MSYLFLQFLRAGKTQTCWEKVLQVRGRRLRICNLFKTLFLLERTRKTSNKYVLGKNFEHGTNLNNYSNRMFFSNFYSHVKKNLLMDVCKGWEFVTFSRHFSCSREPGKQVTNMCWKKNFEHGTNLNNYSNRMFFKIFYSHMKN